MFISSGMIQHKIGPLKKLPTQAMFYSRFITKLFNFCSLFYKQISDAPPRHVKKASTSEIIHVSQFMADQCNLRIKGRLVQKHSGSINIIVNNYDVLFINFFKY